MTPERRRGARPRIPAGGYGPLLDPGPELQLPEGFRYVKIAPAGEAMSDGWLMPSFCDGMGTFSGPDGTVVILRNHEATGVSECIGAPRSAFDPLAPGGVARIVFDTARSA
jgi:uncharacterized protein